MGYTLEGSILEVCNCNVLCPCWIGEDPDNGTCDTVIAYHFDKGEIDGVDVSGHTLVLLAFVPGNILKGNWKVAVYVDDKANEAQMQAITDVWTGKKGGPVADLAGLVGEVVAVEQAPISFKLHEGKGSVQMGDVLDMEMEPYRGPTGEVTTLNESVFTTIPGAPAWVGKASKYIRRSSKHGLADVNLKDHNAIQGTFRFEHN